MYTRRQRQRPRQQRQQQSRRHHHHTKGQHKKDIVIETQTQEQQQQPITQPRCQCDPNCTNPPLSGKSPFCAKHAKKGACKIRSPLSGWEPHYMPTIYNGTKRIQHNHNCFAYAFDVMDPPTDCTGDDCKQPFHQPGYASGYGKIGEKKYCAEMLVRLKGDMPWIKEITFEAKCAPGYSKIAIVIDPNNDYHFYRQDSNGFWSHKPGGQSVTNLDASNKLIYNPELCNRDYRKPGSTDPEQLNYSIFCSFLQVPRNRPVHAKRGGGYFLGGAIRMKGGVTIAQEKRSRRPQQITLRRHRRSKSQMFQKPVRKNSEKKNLWKSTRKIGSIPVFTLGNLRTSARTKKQPERFNPAGSSATVATNAYATMNDTTAVQSTKTFTRKNLKKVPLLEGSRPITAKEKKALTGEKEALNKYFQEQGLTGKQLSKAFAYYFSHKKHKDEDEDNDNPAINAIKALPKEHQGQAYRQYYHNKKQERMNAAVSHARSEDFNLALPAIAEGNEMNE